MVIVINGAGSSIAGFETLWLPRRREITNPYTIGVLRLVPVADFVVLTTIATTFDDAHFEEVNFSRFHRFWQFFIFCQQSFTV